MAKTPVGFDSFITRGRLENVPKGIRAGFIPEKGIVSQGSSPDTAFVDLIVEYNEQGGKAFMMPKAPLSLRLDLSDVSLDHALHIAAEAMKTAFNKKGVKLGRYVDAYSRGDAAVSSDGAVKETYWLRYML